MAIALTPFQALCGFRTINEIKMNLEIFYEINEYLSQEVQQKITTINDNSDTNTQKGFVQQLFYDIMHIKDDQVTILVEKIISRLPFRTIINSNSTTESGKSSSKKQKIVNEKYHNDPDKLATLMLQLNADFPVSFYIEIFIFCSYINVLHIYVYHYSYIHIHKIHFIHIFIHINLLLFISYK